MRQLITVLIVLLLMTIGLACAETTTVMMYMCGSDIHEDCVTDIEEIRAANAGEDTTIVVLAGGTEKWTTRALEGGRLNLFTVKNGRISEVTDLGKGNMGSADTLAGFVKYCEANYPAERKVLVLWDHGSTAAYGMCADSVYDNDTLTLKEMDAALADVKTEYSGFKLDVIGADACLMASYEMACVVEPYADYFVASEELESGLGWYYTNWLNAIGEHPSISGRDLGIAIVDSFIYATSRDDPKDYHTLSVIDLSKMAPLKNAVDGLAGSLIGALDQSAAQISRTARSLYSFGSFDNASSDMVDLKEFAKSIGGVDPEAANAVLEALDDVIVVSYADETVPNANGLSVFVPMENAQYAGAFISDYSVESIGEYDDFAIAFAARMTGNDYVFSDDHAPYQLLDATQDIGFLTSAYGYSSDDASNDWDWQDDGYGNDCDMGYGYGGGFGNGGSLITIAGTAGESGDVLLAIAGQSGETGTSTGITIAGSASATPAPDAMIPPQPTMAPGVTQGIAIAGTTPGPDAGNAQTVTVAIPEELVNQAAICVNLSEDDLENLSYAELHVLLDITDEDEGVYLMDMGRVRDTWVDWKTGRVDALFDGSWPCIDGIPLVLIDQSRTEYARRALVPIRLNGTEDTYLVVRFTAGSKEGTILGTSKGWNENGTPVRGIRALEIGDTFTPRYTLFYSDDPNARLSEMDQEVYTADDADTRIVWDGSLTVSYEQLYEDTYQLAFRLYDIFGEYTDTDRMTVTLNV